MQPGLNNVATVPTNPTAVDPSATIAPQAGTDAGRPAALGPRYWAALSVASVFGATLGDVLSHDLHLGHWRGVPPLLLLGWLVVRGGRRGWLNLTLAYWSAVVLVRAMATNVADLANHDAHFPQPALLAGLVAAMLAGLAWPARPGAAGGPASGLPNTRGSYWVVLFLAGTLGTVLGDDGSDRFGLGGASATLGAILGGALLLRWLLPPAPRTAKAGYWATVVTARTAGTSVGDLLADRTGLGLAGSAAFEGVLLVVVLMVWKARGVTRQRAPHDAPEPRQRRGLWKPFFRNSTATNEVSANRQ